MSETFRGWLGFDDEAVARTGVISQDGYRARLRLKEMIDGVRTPDPAWTNLLKVVMSYAFGTPCKFAPEVEHREPLIYASLDGRLPWDPLSDPLAARTAKVLAEQAAEEAARKALEMGEKSVTIEAKADKDDAAAAEGLELVLPPDDFNPRGSRR